MFNGQSGGWAWYPGGATPAHLSLPPTPATNLTGQITRDDLQKRGEFIQTVNGFFIFLKKKSCLHDQYNNNIPTQCEYTKHNDKVQF